MAGSKYTTIALPSELIQKVDDAIKKKAQGYSSRVEFIKEAIRKKLERDC